MIKIAIFASGTGSNARKIIEHFQNHPEISVALVVSNKREAPVLEMANSFGIRTQVIDKQYFYYSEKILYDFRKSDINFIVLAGFLWLVPSYLIRAFQGRIINIHPALLPKYGGKGMYGMHVHKAVKQAGESETGITIHFVNEEYDKGAIVFQAQCKVEPEDTPEIIAKKVHQLEHQHFPQVIEKLLSAKLN